MIYSIVTANLFVQAKTGSQLKTRLLQGNFSFKKSGWIPRRYTHVTRRHGETIRQTLRSALIRGDETWLVVVLFIVLFSFVCVTVLYVRRLFISNGMERNLFDTFLCYYRNSIMAPTTTEKMNLNTTY